MGLTQLPRRTAMVRRVLDVLPQEIALVAHDGTIVWVNASWRAFGADNSGPVSAGLGWNYLDVCRRSVDAGSGGGSTARAVLGALTAAVDGEASGERSWEYACHGPGVQRWFQVSVRPMADPAKPLRSTGAVVIHEEVTGRVLTEQAYRRQTFEDGLTGLANELHFMDRAGRAIAAAPRNERRAGVVLVDVPGAERVDGPAGRPKPRRLLRAAGQAVRDQVRLPDLVARWSENTLVVLVEDMKDLADLVAAAGRLAAAVHGVTGGTRRGPRGAPTPRLPGVGMALSRPTDTPQDLFGRAQESLLRCRSRGGAAMLAGDPGAIVDPTDLGVVDLRGAALRSRRPG